MHLTMEEKHFTHIQSLQEKLGRAHRELAVLYEIGNAMRTTLDLNHVLYIILTCVTAHTGLGFNRAILFLVNSKERCLEPQMAIGPESGEHAQKIWQYISLTKPHLDDLIKEENASQDMAQSSLLQSVKALKIPLEINNPSLLGKAFHKGAPVHITPQEINRYSDDVLLQTFKTNELVIMPLKAKDKVNGLIIADNLYTQKPVTHDDLRMFVMLANHAGLAIENSHLYEMVRQKSRTDALTHLWNHGFFQDQLTKEIDMSRQTHQPLSLMILDIDDFKKLNDTHGHQNGDCILKEIAYLLKDSSRENDYVCRYGGEEFSIILTQTHKEQGMTIAERLRQRIAGHPFRLSCAEQPLKITVSIGLAVFPDDAQTKEELITKADKAMYIAKFSGKNQTCPI